VIFEIVLTLSSFIREFKSSLKSIS